uniref:Tumor necrosis factor receptor superfamily, member 9a n=1 Tax=Cynoglossus semilaevis TaxID=244447 RepID=A0A3P8WYM0_CYNSE
MAVVLWTMALTLLVQRSLFAVGHSDTGCMKWVQRGEQVCCEACFPGNHLVAECGLSPKNLCTPCEPSTYTVQPRVYSCEPCTQCVGTFVLVKQCTATRDTQCGCKEGLLCGDSACSFCVEKCEKGHEPTKDRSCRPCPEGTFNDQIHQKCKPWRTRRVLHSRYSYKSLVR